MWFGFRTRNVWNKGGLVVEHEMFESNVVLFSTTKCLIRSWFVFRTRNVLIKWGSIYAHELFESNVVCFSNTKYLNQMWFAFEHDMFESNMVEFRTRKVWIQCGLMFDREMFESNVVCFSTEAGHLSSCRICWPRKWWPRILANKSPKPKKYVLRDKSEAQYKAHLRWC